MTTTLTRRIAKLEAARAASQPSDYGAATLGEPDIAFKRTVLAFLLDVITPIHDAGGPLTPLMQELLRLADADAAVADDCAGDDGHDDRKGAGVQAVP